MKIDNSKNFVFHLDFYKVIQQYYLKHIFLMRIVFKKYILYLKIFLQIFESDFHFFMSKS